MLSSSQSLVCNYAEATRRPWRLGALALQQPGSMAPAMEPQKGESFLAQAQRYHAAGGDLNALCRIVEPGDGSVRVEFQGSAGNTTLLCAAATRGWCSAIEWLLAHGADVHSQRGDQQTALHAAALGGRAWMNNPAPQRNRLDAAVLLLDAGARVDASDGERESALDQAASEGDLEMCKLLVSRGASLDARYNDGGDAESTADFLAAVRAAGGWAAYVQAPRTQILALRRELPALRESGRASPSSVRLHERLFVEIPEDVFIHAFQFWRGERDV